MKRLFCICIVILSSFILLFADMTNRDIFYKKVEAIYGYSSNEVNKLMEERYNNARDILKLQSEYAQTVSLFKSTKKYKILEDNEQFVKALPKIISNLYDNLEKSNTIVNSIELKYQKYLDEFNFMGFLSNQGMYENVGYENLLDSYNEKLAIKYDRVLTDILNYYYIKYFVLKYHCVDGEYFEKLDWETEKGKEVERFYWAYYSAVVLKLEDKSE